MTSERRELDKLEVGIEGFDSIADGGLPLGRTTLVAGTAGSGKTLMVTEFTKAAINENQRALLFAFEESREQLFRNATSSRIPIVLIKRTSS